MSKVKATARNTKAGSSNQKLCLQLLDAESEGKVIQILDDHGLWLDESAWQLFGNKVNNFSIIGAQQASPVAALVEKLVNSVDAVLLRECRLEELDPESIDAPTSMAAALEKYFSIKDGNLANVGAEKRTALAQDIGLIATGKKSLPSYIVFDRGEGQTPLQMPQTFLSLAESNKLSIQFVQGKFNMGGTGVLRFCGAKSLQLIISRRHPGFSEKRDSTANKWGFTVVRRDDPMDGRKNSVYRYFAPGGEIATFSAEALELPQAQKGTQRIHPLEWGSIVKLYEYEMTRFKTAITLDLYNQVSLLLPRVGMPIRFYERRDYGARSLETTMAGLHVRLEEDKRDNLEDGFPTSAEFGALGENFKALIYAFKPGRSEKYKKREGVIFTYSGQNHGDFPKSFFTRNRVGMSYLADSILVIVDCDAISPRARETLFMNTRDRLSSGDLRLAIERKLEEIVGSLQGLRDLRESRKREATEAMLADMKPLREALEDVLKKSPSLQALFQNGLDLSNPFKSRLVGEATKFNGKPHPTYFRLMKGHEHKNCHVNLRFRVQFETDVANDYFIRDQYPGRIALKLDGRSVDDHVFNLWNGVGTLTISLPPGTKVGALLKGQARVEDDTLIEPFYSEFTREVVGPVMITSGRGTRRKPAGSGNGSRQQPDALKLPDVHEVREDGWHLHRFDRFSALRVVDDGREGLQFFVNMDNVFLRTEIKALDRNSDPRLVEARFTYGLILVGLALLKDRELVAGDDQGSENGTKPIGEVIFDVTRALSPVLIPMLDVLGNLEVGDLKHQVDLEYES